jgi:dipeptidyl aminopeptidase/acylaminoacyl peptidase
VIDEHSRLTIIDDRGIALLSIPSRAASPIFSLDGALLAYQQLGEESLDAVQPTKGIASYRLESGVETLLTHDADDSQPIAFTPDGSELYFFSTRKQRVVGDSIHGVLVLNIKSGNIARLTGDRSDQGSMISVERLIGQVNHGLTTYWSGGTKIFEIKRGAQGVRVSTLDGFDGPQWLYEDDTFITQKGGSSTVWQIYAAQ